VLGTVEVAINDQLAVANKMREATWSWTCRMHLGNR